jgi:hypothetical protein
MQAGGKVSESPLEGIRYRGDAAASSTMSTMMPKTEAQSESSSVNAAIQQSFSDQAIPTTATIVGIARIQIRQVLQQCLMRIRCA